MITAIMIDSREPEWVQRLTFGGIPTMVTMLSHGDCLASTDDGQMLLVERKTPDDFLGSLRDARLLPQLAEMLDQTRWSYLVVTGEFMLGQGGKAVTPRGETGWSWSAIQGALLTIQEMGIFVTFAANDQDYEACILRLGGRDRRPDLLLEPPRLPRLLSASEAVVAALPGIGTDKLRNVMEYCGTPAWALVALTDPTTKIPGIGEGIKRKIRATLKLGENEQLAVALGDDDKEQLVIAKLGAQ